MGIPIADVHATVTDVLGFLSGLSIHRLDINLDESLSAARWPVPFGALLRAHVSNVTFVLDVDASVVGFASSEILILPNITFELTVHLDGLLPPLSCSPSQQMQNLRYVDINAALTYLSLDVDLYLNGWISSFLDAICLGISACTGAIQSSIAGQIRNIVTQQVPTQIGAFLNSTTQALLAQYNVSCDAVRTLLGALGVPLPRPSPTAFARASGALGSATTDGTLHARRSLGIEQSLSLPTATHLRRTAAVQQRGAQQHTLVPT